MVQTFYFTYDYQPALYPHICLVSKNYQLFVKKKIKCIELSRIKKKACAVLAEGKKR